MGNNIVTSRISSPWVACFFITLVAVVIYSNIYRAPFVFDGVLQIEDKPKIRELSNFFSPRVIFSPRPVVDFTFALNYKLGKLNVFGYHLVNVVIHIINGILVYFLALTIFKLLPYPPSQQLDYLKSPKSQPALKPGPQDIESTTSNEMPTAFQSTIDNRQSSIYWMSLFTALIFVAHPIQTQAVTYTVQRYASMAAMFYFLSILCYVKGRVVAESSKSNAQSIGSQPFSAFKFQLFAYFILSFFCGILQIRTT